MKYSPDGKSLTEAFEGLKLGAYQDSIGVWTIGFGHTRGVYEGQTITRQEAEALLDADMAYAETAVNRLVTVPMTQGQYDALVDFVFNLGAGALAGSTLLRKFNMDDIEGAAQEFTKWVKAGNVTLPGLVNRRLAEKTLFKGTA